MATKGGGLLGGADAQLVQGAFRTEMANVGPNMSGVYAMQAENVGNLQTAIKDIFYATNKSNNDLYNEIKEKSGLILADIESGTFSDDDSIDLYTNAINSLREQAKSIPKGKKGEAQRARVRAQLAKMKTDSANGEGVITEIASLIDNDQISQYAVNEGDLKLFKDILNKTAKREIVNGELVYSTVDANNKKIKINHNELNKRFIKKDYTVEAGALKLSNSFSAIGLQGTKYDFNESMNSYEGLMTTRDGFMHLINKPFGTMKISFAQALQGGDPKLVGEMMGALNSIGGVDIDGDGTPDQITKENYKKLADILINPDAANFSVAKRAAAAFYADNDGRAQHQKGLDIFNAKQDKLNNLENGKNLFNKGKTIPGYSSAGWQTGDVLTSRREFALDLLPFNGVAGEYKYDKGNKHWIVNNDLDNPMQMYDVLKQEGLLVTGDKPEEMGGPELPPTAKPLGMAGGEIENGLLTNVFMLDDEKAIDQMRLSLPKDFVFNYAGTIPKFFGKDEISITSSGGIDLGTYQVGYDSKNSGKALEESKRFNSNLEKYLISPI